MTVSNARREDPKIVNVLGPHLDHPVLEGGVRSVGRHALDHHAQARVHGLVVQEVHQADLVHQ
jgi:hypothetical protein